MPVVKIGEAYDNLIDTHQMYVRNYCDPAYKQNRQKCYRDSIARNPLTKSHPAAYEHHMLPKIQEAIKEYRNAINGSLEDINDHITDFQRSVIYITAEELRDKNPADFTEAEKMVVKQSRCHPEHGWQHELYDKLEVIKQFQKIHAENKVTVEHKGSISLADFVTRKTQGD